MPGKNLSEAFLDRLRDGGSRPGGMPPVLVVAAHPDDEVIGMGACLPRLERCTIVHVTDGAPKDMTDARAAGFHEREEYARARRGELRAALSAAGVAGIRCLELGAVDQEASFDLAGLSRRLHELLEELRPAVILAHPYEGGHPDHDAAAFIAHAAVRLSNRPGTPEPPELVEFTSYHLGGGGFEPYEFLPHPCCEPVTVHLTEEEKEMKRRMVGCFTSQRAILSAFPVLIERFRPAPPYNFTQPPHPGRLLYEYFSRGVTGESWRVMAGEALRELGLGG